MTETPPPQTEKSILLEILNTTRQVRNRILELGFKHTPQSHSRIQLRDVPPPTLSLPFPHDIVEEVQNSPVPEFAQSRIIGRIGLWYKETQSILRSEFEKTLNQLASVPQSSSDAQAARSRLPAVYEALYEDRSDKLRANIENALQQAAVVIAKHREGAANVSGKPRFNNESIPLLETYFEHNAYPSAQDRALLARKSRMCPRQIEVWFQNHRRRAKKEGRRLRRLSQDPLPHELDFEHLNASMPQLLVPEEETRTTPLNESSPIPVVIPVRLHSQHSPAPAATHADNALCAPAPTRAFPTKYPPTPDHVPCLCSGKTWSFPAPEWPRRASGKAPTRKATITPDDLAVEFQKKLSITGSDGVKRTQDQLTAPAWYPFTTTLQPAPHFALIRKPTSTSSPPAPTPFAQLNPTPRDPHSLRQKTSNLTNYKRPTPYQPRQPPKTKPLSRATSNSSLSSISSVSSDESEIIRTPSPSPFARYTELPKEDFAPRHPDWEAYLVPP
uniref:Homeodomain mating-type protein n=1 Tax=Coprinellus disseminatus TaxID=71703 RepID=Q1WMN9_COPDI|nr:homeodomain mating-type protein [Coprinellus disseminatus]